jgi:hypothetical protein
MRKLVLGFVLGVSVSGIVWAGGGQTPMQSQLNARPDQAWEQDRGTSGRGYLQQRQQEMYQELKLNRLRREAAQDHPC